VSPEWTNFLFEALNVGLLALVLAWLAFKPIRNALDAERARRKEAEDELAKRQAAVARQDDAVRQARAQLDAEVEARRQELLAGAKAEADAVRRAAREEADAERRTARGEFAQARVAEAEAAADAIGEVAGASVRRLLDALEGPPLDDALVRAACAELAALDHTTLGAVTVEAARELDRASRDALAAALQGEFAVRVLPELGAGVRVTTAAGQVDATAQALARDAGRRVAQALREGGDGGEAIG